jgi:hypothetical protein
MSEPIILVVDEDTQALTTLTAALQRRFGAEYLVLAEGNPAMALSRLEWTCAHGAQVALVVATDLEWLARVHSLCPRASRCVLVSFGDTLRPRLVRNALARGEDSGRSSTESPS